MVYELVWRGKMLCLECETIKDLIETLRREADDLEKMNQDGVQLDSSGNEDDYFILTTNDKKVAKKWRMNKQTL